MVFFDSLGFTTNYEVDDEIEYPGDGEWGMPVVEVGAPGSPPNGAAIAIIRPAGAAPFVLAETFTSVGGLYGTPNPNVVCVFDRFDALTFVNVSSPTEQSVWNVQPVRIGAAVKHGLLLVATWDSLLAIASDGIRWRSDDIAGDLHITPSNGDRIYFRGLDHAGTEVRGSIDTVTGALVA